MSRLLKYKSYFGSIECSIEDEILFGKIECINDLVTYEGETVNDIKLAFEEAVDDYLETCSTLGREPEKPMSGTFNIRIGEDLHKKAYIHAKSEGISLNDFIRAAVSEKLTAKKVYNVYFGSKDEPHVNRVQNPAGMPRENLHSRIKNISIKQRVNLGYGSVNETH